MSLPASARISAEEIRNRRKLMIECQRSGDAAMVGQMTSDIKVLRVALADLMTAYKECNGTDHEAYQYAVTAMAVTA